MQTQTPVINGVPLNELPELCQRLFDKVVKLRNEEQDLAARHLQKKAALEELANMLASEVEEYKNYLTSQVPTDELDSTDPVSN